MESNLRECPDNMPVDDSIVTAILVRDGIARFAKNKTDKRSLVNEYQEGDLLMAAWTGSWSTDIFNLPIDHLKSV